MEIRLAFIPIIGLLCFAGLARGEGQDVPQRERVLMERPIGETGKTVALIRGPDLPGNVLDFWLRPKGVEPTTLRRCELRLEVRTPGDQTAPLACNLYPTGPSGGKNDLVALSLFVEQGCIYVGVATIAELSIWKVNVDEGTTRVWWIPNRLWSPYAMLHELTDQNVGMKLSRTARGRLGLEIVDRAVPTVVRHVKLELTDESAGTFEKMGETKEQK